MTIFTSIELSVESSTHTIFPVDVRHKRSITVPFLISVSLHVAAAFIATHVVIDALHQPPPPIEIDIVTPLPEKTKPPTQRHSEQKAAALPRQTPKPVAAPVSTPPVVAPRPIPASEQMNQAHEPVSVVDRSTAPPQTVPAVTSQAKPVATIESGIADVPVIGPSYDAAYLSNPPPPYPAAARRLKLQGTATVRVMVSADGHPTSVTLEKGSGARILDEAAVEAVRHWSFVPARRGTKAIAAVVNVPVRFRLN